MKKEKWVPVDLPEEFASYAQPCPFSAQDVWNYIPEYASVPGARNKLWLRGVPGLKPWADFGAGPCRGLHDLEGRRLAVVGNYLYEIAADGESASYLGYVPGHGRVQMAHNQIAGGYELAIANGSAGYIYNTVSGTFQKITDSSFSGGKSVTFIDQMFVWVDAQGRHFQPSDIADGLTYTALEEQEAEMSPDRLQCVVAAFQKLIALSKNSSQFYTSTGDPEELFSDDKSGNDTGHASPHCVSKLDNTLFSVTDKGVGVRLSGTNWERVTTHAIEEAWAMCDLSKCFSFTWEDRGHAVWYVTFPVALEGGKPATWGYDCATRKWHRRETFGMDRWRVSALVKWGQTWYAGTFNSGVLYALDWNYPYEGCDELEGGFVIPELFDAGNRLQLDGVKVDVDTGHETVDCVSVDPITLPAELTITGTLDDGVVDEPYSSTLSVSGGVPPYSSVSVVMGELPPGLDIDLLGAVITVSGTPT